MSIHQRLLLFLASVAGGRAEMATTCAKVKDFYKKQKCCGLPEKLISLAPSDLVDSHSHHPTAFGLLQGTYMLSFEVWETCVKNVSQLPNPCIVLGGTDSLRFPQNVNYHFQRHHKLGDHLPGARTLTKKPDRNSSTYGPWYMVHGTTVHSFSTSTIMQTTHYARAPNVVRYQLWKEGMLHEWESAFEQMSFFCSSKTSPPDTLMDKLLDPDMTTSTFLDTVDTLPYPEIRVPFGILPPYNHWRLSLRQRGVETMTNNKVEVRDFDYYESSDGHPLLMEHAHEDVGHVMIVFLSMRVGLDGTAPTPPSNASCVTSPDERKKIQTMFKPIKSPFGPVFDPSPDDMNNIYTYGKDPEPMADRNSWPAKDSRVDVRWLNAVLSGSNSSNSPQRRLFSDASQEQGPIVSNTSAEERRLMTCNTDPEDLFWVVQWSEQTCGSFACNYFNGLTITADMLTIFEIISFQASVAIANIAPAELCSSNSGLGNGPAIQGCLTMAVNPFESKKMEKIKHWFSDDIWEDLKNDFTLFQLQGCVTAKWLNSDWWVLSVTLSYELSLVIFDVSGSVGLDWGYPFHGEKEPKWLKFDGVSLSVSVGIDAYFFKIMKALVNDYMFVDASCEYGGCGEPSPYYDCIDKGMSLNRNGENMAYVMQSSTAKLVVQADGNLVIYGMNGPVWATRSNSGTGAFGLVFQEDSNLVLYPTEEDAGNKQGAMWASGTINAAACTSNCKLVLQPDCNLVLYGDIDCKARTHPSTLANTDSSNAIWSAMASSGAGGFASENCKKIL